MRERNLHWLLLLAAIAAALAVVVRSSHFVANAPALDPLQAVPAGPGLLATADVRGLTQTAGNDLSDLGAEQLVGVRATCGFEPLLAVQQVALVMPFSEGNDAGTDFALIATTSLGVNQVVACAEKVLQKRGGRPVVSRVGAFSTLHDAQHPLGEVGVRKDGLLVLSGGAYFRAVLDAASGIGQASDTARLRDQLHAQLRRTLGHGQVQLTLVPGDEFVFPGVRAMGLGLNMVGRDVELKGIVGCDTAAACGETKSALERTLRQLATVSGLPALSGFMIQQQEGELRAATRLPTHDLKSLIRQLLFASPEAN